MKVPAGRDGNPIIVIGAFGGSGQGNTQCNAIVERVDNLGGGQYRVKYVGCNYLFKGLLESVRLQAAYPGKRIIAGLPKLLSNRWILAGLSVFGTFFFILPAGVRKSILLSLGRYFGDIGYMGLQDYVIPEQAYCPAAGEFYRAFTAVVKKHYGSDTANEEVEILFKLRDLISMIIHFDMAYRFRWQDIMPHFNKQALHENARREIMRVYGIFMERGGERFMDKWGFVMRNLNFILWLTFLNRRWKKLFLEFMDELDLDKIAPDEADWYYMLDREDYDYGGVSYKERMKISAEMDVKAGNRRMKVADPTPGKVILHAP